MRLLNDEFDTGATEASQAKKDAVFKQLKWMSPIFLATVVVPSLIAVLYFGFLANDVYVSESRFVVRSPSKNSISPLGAMLSGGGLTGASEENSAVTEYLQSRAALDDADGDGLIRKAYTMPGIFWFDRFGGTSGTTKEQLYRYFLTKATVVHEPTTQVMRLTVRAYDPKNAERINSRLLQRSEALVNRLSERARADSIRVAQGEVDAAKATARQAAVALSRYRNRERIIDPEKEATVRLQMISKLQDELIASRTQLQQMDSYTPRASQIPFLRTRIRSLQREINEQTAGVAGGSRSLSVTAARYRELLLDSELSGKLLAATLASLQDAQSEARRKRAYVERISDPNLPDYAVEPRRVRGILATLILGLLAWGVLSTLIVGIREHREG
jgi:ABC-2 type transport system permease protein/capsular polysaccharide transport system permease protein